MNKISQRDILINGHIAVPKYKNRQNFYWSIAGDGRRFNIIYSAESDKFGIIDNSGDWIIEPTYQNIIYIISNAGKYFICFEENCQTLFILDENFGIKFEVRFENVKDHISNGIELTNTEFIFDTNLLFISCEKAIIIDGKIVAKDGMDLIIYDFIKDKMRATAYYDTDIVGNIDIIDENGMLYLKINDRYYIDLDGNKIYPNFGKIKKFANFYTIQQNNSGYYAIVKAENRILFKFTTDFIFSKIYERYDKLFIGESEFGVFLIDRDGNIIFDELTKTTDIPKALFDIKK